LGDHGGVDVRIVGGRDHIPGALEISVAEFPEFQGDSRLLAAQRLHRGGGGAGDDVDVRTAGDQQRQPALGDTTAPDDNDLLAGQQQSGEVGVLAHSASLDVAAGIHARPAVPAATKRLTAWGWAAGWTCRYPACTPRCTAPS